MNRKKETIPQLITICRHLSRNGPTTGKALGEIIGVTETAAGKRMQCLAQHGIVRKDNQRAPWQIVMPLKEALATIAREKPAIYDKKEVSKEIDLENIEACLRRYGRLTIAGIMSLIEYRSDDRQGPKTIAKRIRAVLFDNQQTFAVCGDYWELRNA